jgi:hypothetical protein
MRNVVLGLAGIVWGGAVIVYGFVHGIGGSSYGAGQAAAICLGFLLLFAGARVLLRARG